MISELYIENFKSVKSAEFSFGSLNVFTGLNGMGKSSVIQILLLLRQSLTDGKIVRLKLNGEFISLGRARDVITEGSSTLKIKAKFDDEQFAKWHFEEPNVDSFRDYIDEVSDTMDSLKSNQDYQNDSFFLKALFFLGAERIGPKIRYEMVESAKMESLVFDPRGEALLQFLFENDDMRVREDLIHEQLKQKLEKDLENDGNAKILDSLLANVNAWMGDISPDVKIEPRMHKDIDSVSLGISFKRNNLPPTSFYRPINVGFGITYALPVVILLLIAEPGSTILIENPEAHLHPRGQSQIARLAALAAKSGVQVFLETHSDHVFNSVRVSVKESVLDKDQVSIYYFERNPQDDSRGVIPTKIGMNSQGKMDRWPDGFFDEWRNMLDRLI